MSKAPGVLVPPVISVINKHHNVQQNSTVFINSICMFGPSDMNAISFALLGGHNCIWLFNNIEERNAALKGIYDQLGVIE